MAARLDIVTAAAHSATHTRKGEGDVVELADGRLFLAYMEFSGDGSDVAPTRIVAVESSDGGYTWGNHRLLAETEPGDVNVYSPNLVPLPNGEILFIFMRRHRASSCDDHSRDPGAATQFVWKSTDSGQSFQPFSTFLAERPLSLCNAVVKRLSNGRLVLPLNKAVERDGSFNCGAGAAA